MSLPEARHRSFGAALQLAALCNCSAGAPSRQEENTRMFHGINLYKDYIKLPLPPTLSPLLFPGIFLITAISFNGVGEDPINSGSLKSRLSLE